MCTCICMYVVCVYGTTHTCHTGHTGSVYCMIYMNRMYVCVHIHEASHTCVCVYICVYHTYIQTIHRLARDQMRAFWHETTNNIIFLDTTFTIPICTPHSLLESRESGDHRGMYGVQIRVFFLVLDFAFNGALCTSFLFIDLRSENRKIFAKMAHLISQLQVYIHTYMYVPYVCLQVGNYYPISRGSIVV
jgi:hypothetical protein